MLVLARFRWWANCRNISLRPAWQLLRFDRLKALRRQRRCGKAGDPVGDNRYKVKLLRNGETREREVTIGARNDTDVEIVKGLEAGDEVVIGEAKPGAAQ